jgi:cytochrome c biogenesis protein CcmG/thiol:disulfide interchange protein DsbE
LNRKDLLQLVLVVALASAGAVGFVRLQRHKGYGLKIGEPAPDFRVTRLDGGEISLAGLRGHVVLVNLWASWCPPCLEEMPSLERLHQQLGGQGLMIVGVSADTEEPDIVSVVQKDALSFTIARDPDGKMANAYHATGYPESYLVDRGGVLREAFIGPVEFDAPETLARIRSVLAGPRS